MRKFILFLCLISTPIVADSRLPQDIKQVIQWAISVAHEALPYQVNEYIVWTDMKLNGAEIAYEFEVQRDAEYIQLLLEESDNNMKLVSRSFVDEMKYIAIMNVCSDDYDFQRFLDSGGTIKHIYTIDNKKKFGDFTVNKTDCS